ncbi:uroplakin-3a isoform X2 [Pteronotus mesoamericanus]|uniref:uroplakin-3a isoform X2 n=1 Tax=Pteronotus mesoamericanus TaxID=1884717 RepID=UPI0023EC48A6|nr:uroplakin-3a isoform X2 [Pteronotus parnellii mesoamericanus]
MPPLWAWLALGCLRLCRGVNLQPQLASLAFATNNPTLSTVALEKPLCMFDSTAALNGTYEIYLYVLANAASPYLAIDTWPGRRSGGMIVITSILGSLPFFLLLGFAGAIVLSLLDMGGSEGEATHDSQITQEAVPKSLGTAEPSYAAVNRGLPLDRAEVYRGKLQD